MKHRYLTAIVAIALAGTAHAAPVFYPGTGHWYEAVYTPQGIGWETARDDAQTAGGYLATSLSQDENEFIYGLVTDLSFWLVDGVGNSQGPFLGGIQAPDQPEPDIGWGWVTGEPWAFTNWATAEPNDAGLTLNVEDNEENVLQFFRPGRAPNGQPWTADTWNDIVVGEPPNSYVHGYVIEYDRLVGGIALIKEVEGPTPPLDWVFDTDMPLPVAQLVLPAAGGSVGFAGIPVGDYSLTETTQPDYTVTSWASTGQTGGASITFSINHGETTTVVFTNTFIPEPATLGLLAIGVLALRRRRRR